MDWQDQQDKGTEKEIPNTQSSVALTEPSLPLALKLPLIHVNAEGTHNTNARTQILNILSNHVQSSCCG